MRPLLVLLAATALGAAVPLEPVARDAAAWPFAATSPWNTALGDQATYLAIASPRFSASKGGSLNWSGFSHPVFIATAADPEVDIFKRGTASPFAHVHVPVDARPDGMGDGHLHIIDELHRSVIEMWQAVRNPDGSITARAVVRNDLSDDGIYPVWHGVRAYGGSAIAGLIRSGELSHGIRHALAIAVEQAALNRAGPGGRNYVWPASSADNNNAYGSSGNLFMGSLLAIPPEVDLRRLGLRGPSLELAIALQDYGAYITDCTGSNLSFYAEPAAAEEAGQIGRGDSDRLVALLKVVGNNSAQTVGGGGKPRRPPAPPIVAPDLLSRAVGSPPSITTEPAGATVAVGQALRLGVVASGSQPLSYRWRRGSSVVGGNAAELVIPAARPANAGSYTCTVGNPYGKAVSAVAVVTITGGEPAPVARTMRRPAAAVLAAWAARLQAVVRSGLAARREPQYRCDMLRGTVTITALAEDATLTVRMATGGTMLVPWSQLHDGELASLALDVAREDVPGQHALAAFFLLLAGDAVNARIRQAQAGSEAAAVEAAFADPVEH